MRKFACLVVVLAAIVLAAPVASGQTVINPSTVTFTASADHATLDRYVIGFFAPGASTPMQEVDLGKGTPDATQTIALAINTRPLVFGVNYVAKVRAVAGAASSEWSDASNPFSRVPGKPGGPALK